MTSAEWELAHLTLFIEDNITELRNMLKDLPRDEFSSVQNKRTFYRLRGAAIELTSLFLTASAMATDKETR